MRNSTSSKSSQEDPVEQQNDRGDLLTIREVAVRLRVDGTTVRRWIANGLLDAVILPHRNKRKVYRVKKQTLDQLLQTGLPVEEGLDEQK